MRLIINKIILLAGIFVFVSCADLDLVDPNQPTEASFWKTENDLYAGVIAAYDALQTSDQRGRLLLMSDLGSYKGIWSRFESFQWGNLNLFENEWRQGYDLIGRGFQVIDRAGSVSGAGVPRIVAEAKFLVALGYFRLLTGFGDHIAYVDRIQNPGDVPRRAEAGRTLDTNGNFAYRSYYRFARIYFSSELWSRIKRGCTGIVGKSIYAAG